MRSRAHRHMQSKGKLHQGYMSLHVKCVCVCVSDGLMDCVDPDCCSQQVCASAPLCQGSPDPRDIIQQSHAPFETRPSRQFFNRVRFLIGRDSTHILPGDLPFDSR